MRQKRKEDDNSTNKWEKLSLQLGERNWNWRKIDECAKTRAMKIKGYWIVIEKICTKNKKTYKSKNSSLSNHGHVWILFIVHLIFKYPSFCNYLIAQVREIHSKNMKYGIVGHHYLIMWLLQDHIQIEHIKNSRFLDFAM